MNIQIKRATIDDLADIQKLNLMLFETEISLGFDDTLNLKWTFGKDGEEYFKMRIEEDRGGVFVARVDDTVVGYLAGAVSQAGSFRNISKLAELENIFILQEYRGMEVGTRLYMAFTEWCRSKEVSRIRVVASAKNTNGINFYKKNGFFEHELILEADL